MSVACRSPLKVWQAYEPSSEAPWTLERVVHLHRRAGLSVAWPELRRDLEDGHAKTLDRFIGGRVTRPTPDFEVRSKAIADACVAMKNPDRVRAWWTWRMLNTPDPLGERLTLFWHDHFATGLKKVQEIGWMFRQNETFRALARDRFQVLLKEAISEPALLVWLDAPANTKRSPNENLARELLELFALGIGAYEESDVRECARALSGWTVRDGKPYHHQPDHDPGPKTILGETRPFQTQELVDFLAQHPATAHHIVTRLCDWLVPGETLDADAKHALAKEWQDQGLDIGWLVETVLRSRAFFCESNLRQRVLDPPGFVIGAARALNVQGLSTMLLANWLTRLGMMLFDPPNVGGWPGGRSWLTTRHVLGRVRYAAALIEGRTLGTPEVPDFATQWRAQAPKEDDPIRHFAHLWLGRDASESLRKRIEGVLNGDPWSPSIISLLLSSPEAQLA